MTTDATGPFAGAGSHLVVIGGGPAGLVAARAALVRAAAGRGATPTGVRVTVLEAAPAVGGCVARHQVGGLALDAGAESFATRGGAVAQLVDELGLGDRLEWPNAAGAWLHLPDGPVPAPKGGLLGIPVDPLASDVVAAIGAAAAQRAARDLTDPWPDGFAPRTLGELVRVRMGTAVLDRLVSPVATGVYSTAADDLDIDAVAPGLGAALVRTGSLARAVAELRQAGSARPAAPGSAAGGLRGGMWTLIDALAADVTARGGVIRAGVRAVGLSRAADGWRVRLAPPHPGAAADGILHADVVIVATAQSDAMPLLADALAPGDLPTDWPEPTRVDLATLVLDARELDAAPRGTGLLVADHAHADVAAKALTHATAKWSWLAAAAGSGRHVVRLSCGKTGQRNPAAGLDDAALRALALQDAATLLGVRLRPDQVVGFARARWATAVSLAAHGQADRVAAVRAAVAGETGLEVTGSWVAGTGLASVVPDATDAGARAFSRLARAR
ncbi:protoporphyrinogen/coproporphyrinogen oxidase [Microbacterium luticocti]|uniref:protoporphyrinogen/coproporphyrinogen oxidase n=1 Tax=Microbacterium luticocti TaxID=451764 RepID=UPI0004252250|nr:FAD-dependent oxidoreductase [Microbacterium luticocti]